MTKNIKTLLQKRNDALMNKKFILYITAFFLILNAQTVYLKAEKEDTPSRSTAAIEQNFSSPKDTFSPEEMAELEKAMWQFVQDAHEKITEQTQQIEYSLETIERIAHADKLKIDTKKISKAQLLEEIKYIKKSIHNVFEYFTTQLAKQDSIVIITCYNTVFIDYLLPLFKGDITNISVAQFEMYIEQNIEAVMLTLQDPMQLEQAIDTNEKNIQTLLAAADLVGLSMINRIYNYLDTKALPWYGKTTIETAKDIVLWGGSALLAYSILLYGLPKESPIYGTNWKVGDLWGKSQGPLSPVYVGDFHDVLEARHPGTEPARKEQLINEYGLYSYLHDGTLTYADPFMIGAVGAISWLVKKPAMQLFEESQKTFNYMFNYYIKGDVAAPKQSADMTKVYFKDMVGCEHLEREAQLITDYLKNPTRYERQGNGPSTGYLLVGPSQTGKSFFAKALKTMIDEAFEGTSQKVKFAVITAYDVEKNGFDEIFYWARKHSPIILFIDEIDMFGTRRDRSAKNTQELLTALNGIETDPSQKVIVMAATNKPEELDFAIKQKGRLGTVITFDLPTYESRKTYLQKQLTKRNIVISPEMIETIAQETDNNTYNMIDDIIRQASQLATFKKRPVVEKDFEDTLDREVRKIKPNTTMSADEQEKVAIYHAGQAVARHVLQTEQQIVKITIETVDKPMKSKEGVGFIQEQKGELHENHELLPQTRIKPTRLGFVFTMSKTNNQELISDLEQEHELMALLAGQAALELVKGTTFTGFGKEERAKVIEALERKISQGTPITDAIRLQALAAKDVLYQRIKQTLQQHTQFITVISNELIKNRTITAKQWLELTKNYNA